MAKKNTTYQKTGFNLNFFEDYFYIPFIWKFELVQKNLYSKNCTKGCEKLYSDSSHTFGNFNDLEIKIQILATYQRSYEYNFEIVVVRKST